MLLSGRHCASSITVFEFRKASGKSFELLLPASSPTLLTLPTRLDASPRPCKSIRRHNSKDLEHSRSVWKAHIIELRQVLTLIQIFKPLELLSDD